MNVFKLFFTLSLVVGFAIIGSSQTHYSCYVQGDSCYRLTCIDDCNCEGRHPIFKKPNTNPIVVPSLGGNPQFGTLRFYTTSAQVYQHLKRTYRTNQHGNAAELDRLWKAMGYSGFSDPRFTPDRVNAIIYENGAVGMLGAGGHKYIYATVEPDKKDGLKAYKITAEGNKCDIAIMETCGNAFFGGCVQSCTTTSCKLNLPASAPQGKDLIRIGFSRNDSCFVQICDQRSLKLLHPIYKIPTVGTPKAIPSLGSNPQFGTLRNYKNSAEVYQHLQRVYKTNANGNAAELDRLWQAMGYTGFKDPSFTAEDLTLTLYSGGITGMLGAGGHTYTYSTISSNLDVTLRAYKVNAPGNCDISIMETCGNAFFTGCELLNCQTFPCGCK